MKAEHQDDEERDALLAEQDRLREALAGAERRAAEAEARLARAEREPCLREREEHPPDGGAARAAEGLPGANAELDAVFRALPDLYFRLGADGTILDHRAGHKMGLYRPPVEFMGKRMQDVLPADVGGLWREAIPEVLRTQSSVTLEYYLPMEGGQKAYEARLLPLPGQQVVAVIRDQTERLRAKAALARSESLYRSLVETSPDAIVLLDLDLRMLMVNEQTVRLGDWASAEALVGKNVREFFEPEEQPGLGQLAEKVLREKRVAGVELPLPKSDGSRLLIEVNASVVAGDGHGKPEAILAILRDVTERKRAEQSLRESEEQFRTLSDFAPIGIFRMDAEGWCTYVNPRWAEITGRSAEEGLGYGWLNTLHPDDRRLLLEEWRETTRHASEWHSEKRTITPDGTTRWILVRAKPIGPGDGPPTDYIGTIEDITEDKRLEEMLLHREREFRTLADNAPDIIARFDRSFRHLYINHAAERLLGIPVAAFIGKTNRDLGFSAELVACWEQHICRVFETGEPGALEFSIPGPEGSAFYEAQLVPELGSEGRVESVLGITRDVTARRRAEEEKAQALERERAAHAEAQEANQAKDRFLTILSHELRNPLAPVLAGVEILRRSEPQDPRVQRTVEVMERNIKLEARLVDDLLDLSRIARGKIQLHRRPTPLCLVVKAAVETQQAEASKAGLSLRVETAPGLWVQGDPDRLQQMVVNLLTNAVKFTPPGGAITVTTSKVESVAGEEGEPQGPATETTPPATGCRARIVVEDTGIGIPRDLLPHLFRMFEQGDIAGKRTPGLGIGLALVRSFAEMHGGRVWAESEGVGRGSRFTVELPTVASPTAEHPAEGGNGEGPHTEILLVEDNADTLALLTDSLEMMGYEVEAAASGEDALEVLHHAHPDVIVSDIGLPGMDGYEFLRRARRLSESAGVPALALTGWGREQDVRQAKDAGYAGHLTKPIDVEVLEQRIREALGSHGKR